MKNPFTPEEKVLIFNRLELEHYQKPEILCETPAEIQTLLSQAEFKISDYKSLVWVICYIAANPDYVQDLQDIYNKHESKLFKLQKQIDKCQYKIK